MQLPVSVHFVVLPLTSIEAAVIEFQSALSIFHAVPDVAFIFASAVDDYAHEFSLAVFRYRLDTLRPRP